MGWGACCPKNWKRGVCTVLLRITGLARWAKERHKAQKYGEGVMQETVETFEK